MPFGSRCEFVDFAACVRANRDRDDPQAYCAELMRRTEDRCKRVGLRQEVRQRVGSGLDTALRQAMARLTPRMSRELDRFFAEQARRGVAIFLEGETRQRKSRDPNEIIPSADAGRLARAAAPFVRDMLERASGVAGDLVGVGGLTGQDPGLLALLARSASRITNINDATRDAVRVTIQEGISRGYSDFQIARGVPDDAFPGLRDVITETYKGRADTIARTELATSSQEAATERYSAAGVTQVEVLDGPGCGWTSHDDPDEANGSLRTLDQAAEFPISHPNAVMYGTWVEPVGRVEVAYRARWNGPLVSIRTAGAAALSIGPNHPILTGRGWVAAKSVRVGDDVVHRADRWAQRADPVHPHLDDMPALIEEIFTALAEHGALSRCVAAGYDFHGDGNYCEGEIDVVEAYRRLPPILDGLGGEQAREGIFDRTRVEAAALTGQSPLSFSPGRVDIAAPRGMSGFHMRGVRIAAPDRAPSPDQPVADGAIANPKFCRDLARRLSGGVTLDQVVYVGLDKPRITQAFDLQTGEGMYFAGGILTHNCVRVFVPVTE